MRFASADTAPSRPWQRVLGFVAGAATILALLLPLAPASERPATSPVSIEPGLSPIGFARTAEAASGEAVPKPNAVLVRQARGAPALANARSLGNGVRAVRDVPRTAWRKVELDPGVDATAKAAELRTMPGIEQAVPDYFRRITYQPNDQYFNLQWNFVQVQAADAWDLSTGEGVTVAILDTGLHPGGSDQPENIVTGYNFFDGSANTDDDHGHGTHIAGTIAQRTNNDTGVAGLAYKAAIMPLKICDASGLCPDSAIISAMIYARERGAKVINLSLGGPDLSPALSDAVADALLTGVVVVAAIGNGGIANQAYYPAALPGVIAVGASRVDKTKASYSNYGRALWLLAPGGDLRVDQNGDAFADGIPQQTLGRTCGQTTEFGYCFYQGTSMATPHVAATAALMLARNSALSPKQIMTMLATSAFDLGPCGWDNETGYGLLQSYRAVATAAGFSAAAPTPTPKAAQFCPQSPLITPTRWFVPVAPVGFQGWSTEP